MWAVLKEQRPRTSACFRVKRALGGKQEASGSRIFWPRERVAVRSYGRDSGRYCEDAREKKKKKIRLEYSQ